MKITEMFNAAVLFFLVVIMCSCEPVIRFFEEGMGYGILTFIAVATIIVILMAPVRKRRFRKRKK